MKKRKLSFINNREAPIEYITAIDKGATIKQKLNFIENPLSVNVKVVL